MAAFNPVAPKILQTFGIAATVPNAALEYVFDGSGQALTAGLQGTLEVPFACIILSSKLFADEVGSAVMDVWMASTFASYPPTIANSICAADLPTLANAQSVADSTLTGWTISLPAGAILMWNLTSTSLIKRLTHSLSVIKLTGFNS